MSAHGYIDILPLDSAVTIGPEDDRLDGTVIGVAIYPAADGPQVQYRVVWWSRGERKTEWLNEPEVEASTAKTLRVGFAVGNGSARPGRTTATARR